MFLFHIPKLSKLYLVLYISYIPYIYKHFGCPLLNILLGKALNVDFGKQSPEEEVNQLNNIKEIYFDFIIVKLMHFYLPTYILYF